MSLWRVKHTLSSVVEYALVALVAVYGLFGIYLSSLRLLIDAAPAPVTSLPQPVPLDASLWTRHDDASLGYAYASPPGWIVVDAYPGRVRLGRTVKEAGMAGREGEGILMESVPLYEGEGIEDAAAAEFAGRRPALYDVHIDGRPSLFAIEFENGRVSRQAAYVPLNDGAIVIRAARTDPAAFAMFLSGIRFYSSEEITTVP